jgi:hypothetical protein
MGWLEYGPSMDLRTSLTPFSMLPVERGRHAREYQHNPLKSKAERYHPAKRESFEHRQKDTVWLLWLPLKG